MIQAKLITGGADELFASFYHENSNKEVAYQKVENPADAERLVYFYNRNYIAKTMISWLKMRKYAMILNNNPDAEKAWYLLESLKNIQHGTFRTIEKFIRDNMSAFNKCIPGAKSTQFKHYEKEIKPLLNFCTK